MKNTLLFLIALNICWCTAFAETRGIRKVEIKTKSGETIGNHSVIMTNKKETLNLMHQAHDRSLYSEGAIKAALWLKTKKAGLYSMRDVLKLG